jgi:hypothetical protein
VTAALRRCRWVLSNASALAFVSAMVPRCCKQLAT